MAGLHQLQVEGVTREMYIWGNVQVSSSSQSRNRCFASCMVVRADMQHVASMFCRQQPLIVWSSMVANLGEQCVRQRARSQCFSQPASLIISSKLTGRLKMQGQWVRGIIDQLELDDTGRIRVVEHKTRRKPSLPMFAQQQTAKLQVAELLSWLPTEQLVCITMHVCRISTALMYTLLPCQAAHVLALPGLQSQMCVHMCGMCR